VPWALLSGGDPYELFLEQVETACRAGASGFMVGRALWGEAVTAPADRRQRMLADVAGPRLRELAASATRLGRSWADVHDWPAVDEHWYLTY
jgi:tagatose 1,6-diphosphate aldolase